MRALVAATLFLGLSGRLLAAEYFVEKGGDDANPGSRMRPFRSIQKAASLMGPGDVCTISRGLYRETIRPARSGKPGAPLRFRNAPGETVSIGGADEVGGWQCVSGSLYQVKADLAIQLLVDSAPARRAASLPGESADPQAAWWHDEARGAVFLHFPRNEAPDGHQVEIQTREWGVDCGGLANIELAGVNLLACGINLTGARMCKLDDCHVWWGGGRASLSNAVSGSSNAVPFRAAVLVGGRENEIVNSSVIGNSGYGIALLGGGVNNLVVNSLLRGRNDEADGAVGILAQGTAPVIRQVTVMHYSGGAMLCSNVMNARIDNNDFHHGGGTNTSLVRLTGDGKGTVLSFNWIHDNAGAAGTGLRLEGPVENYVVRQNVIWGQPGAAFVLKSPCRYNFIYNNTCAVNGAGIEATGGADAGEFRETRVQNNILAGPVWPANGGEPPAGVDWKDNYTGSTPGFVDEMNRNFRLAAGSPCIGVAGDDQDFTDDSGGPLPARGAYEFGRDYPVPGCQVNEAANKVVTPVVRIMLETATPGAEIRYTLDGRDPDAGSPLYTGAVSIVYGARVRARAFHAGMAESRSATVQVQTME